MIFRRMYPGHWPWGQIMREAAEAEIDFSQPAGEPALTAADSVSWIVFNNPVSLYIGGIAAVLMELAEPRVRSGVWDHTTFRTDPLRRMRRTGLAAMVTVYGPHLLAEGMIARIRRMHEKIHGVTPSGIPYQANDPELLRWVHATAAYGFMEAYQAFVQPLTTEDRSRYYQEGVPVAALYGATDVPDSEEAFEKLCAGFLPRLEPSAILGEFLRIMRSLPLIPRPLRFLNRFAVEAAISILPPPVRERLGLSSIELSRTGRAFLRFSGRAIERLPVSSSPASMARERVAAAHSA